MDEKRVCCQIKASAFGIFRHGLPGDCSQPHSRFAAIQLVGSIMTQFVAKARGKKDVFGLVFPVHFQVLFSSTLLLVSCIIAQEYSDLFTFSWKCMRYRHLRWKLPQGFHEADYCRSRFQVRERTKNRSLERFSCSVVCPFLFRRPGSSPITDGRIQGLRNERKK